MKFLNIVYGKPTTQNFNSWEDKHTHEGKCLDPHSESDMWMYILHVLNNKIMIKYKRLWNLNITVCLLA